MTSPASAPSPVSRRLVFYLSGFDPRGVRYYHQLFREQAARYAALSGDHVEVSSRTPGELVSAWTARDDAADVTAELRFLRWEDIVSAAWIRDPLALAWRAARTYAAYLTRSDWRWARSLQRGPLITLFYPGLLTLAVPLAIALVLAPVGAIWLRWPLAALLALALGIVISIPLLTRIKAYWLLRFFIFNSEQAGGSADPAIAARLDAFATQLVDELERSAADEILLVAHSNGSILAMPLMDRVIAKVGADLPGRFALVTLGHCIPLVSGRNDMPAYHAILRRVARARFRWVDIGSPTDGAAYATVDPLLKHADATPRTTPQRISPRWFKFFTDLSGKVPWNRKYDNHFNYLRVGDRLSPLDFPSLVLSPRRLDDAIAAFQAIP